MNATSAYVEGDRLDDNDLNDEENFESDWNEGGSSGIEDNEEVRGNEMAGWNEGTGV